MNEMGYFACVCGVPMTTSLPYISSPFRYFYYSNRIPYKSAASRIDYDLSRLVVESTTSGTDCLLNRLLLESIVSKFYISLKSFFGRVWTGSASE